MHGKGVPEVEGRSLLLEELPQLGGEVGWRVHAKDLASILVIPAGEEGHFKPPVALRARSIFRAVVVRVVVQFSDHFDQTAEPGR